MHVKFRQCPKPASLRREAARISHRAQAGRGANHHHQGHRRLKMSLPLGLPRWRDSTDKTYLRQKNQAAGQKHPRTDQMQSDDTDNGFGDRVIYLLGTRFHGVVCRVTGGLSGPRFENSFKSFLTITLVFSAISFRMESS